MNRSTRIAALGTSLILLAGCGLLPPEAEETGIEIAAPVVTQREIATVGRGSVESKLNLNITFGAEKQSLLYFRSSGRVKKLYAIPGQRVEAGTLLAELESSSLPYDLASAEMDLERVQNKLDLARSRVGFTDGPDANTLRNYELDLKASQLKYQRLLEQLADTRIYATHSGQVIQVDTSEGTQVESDKTVITLAGDGPVLARAPVTDAQAAQMAVGQLVDLYPADGDPTPVKAKVLAVPIVGTRDADRIALFAPVEPSARLRVGRNGRADVMLQRKDNVLLVPLSAIRTFSNRTFVTLVEGESRREVAIETGIVGDKFAEVLSGLKEGDRVVGR